MPFRGPGPLPAAGRGFRVRRGRVGGNAPRAALEALASDEHSGLGSDEAAARLGRHGRNSLPERPGKPAWLRLLLQFHQPLIYILLASGTVTALLG